MVHNGLSETPENTEQVGFLKAGNLTSSPQKRHQNRVAKHDKETGLWTQKAKTR